MKLATPSTRPETGHEEKALVERMLAGDETAMETFADGYFPGLYRFALKRVDGRSELARDLVQNTVCKVLYLAWVRDEVAGDDEIGWVERRYLDHLVAFTDENERWAIAAIGCFVSQF